MAGRFGAIGSNLSIGAGQSVRRKAADDGFEAYTPEAGGVAEASIKSIAGVSNG